MNSTFQLAYQVNGTIQHTIKITDARYTKEQIIQGLNDGIYFISTKYCIMNESYEAIAEIKGIEIMDDMVMSGFEEEE